MIDIINAHVNAGYHCVLITGRLVERNIVLDNSVELKRIARYNRTNAITRLYSWVTGFLQILFLLWFRFRKSHLFIVSNPPFAPLIPLFCRNSCSILIFDVYIEKPGEFRFIGKLKPLINIWIKAHVKSLLRAHYIFTLTEGMRNSLKNYSKGKSIDVIPVWSDNKFLKPVCPDLNPFIMQHNLKNKFVVLYSGNIGSSRGLEALLDVANIVNREDILFLIIGDGFRKKELLKKAKRLMLNNCQFLPWQDSRMLPYSLSSASLAVITLSETSSFRSIPSKLYSYMSVGTPVLCIANRQSDLVYTVNKYKIGKCFDSQMIADIADFITDLADSPDKRYTLSKNSVIASEMFTPKNALRFVREYQSDKL